MSLPTCSPRWKTQADLSNLQDRIVRLKFYLDTARLYAFQIKADETMAVSTQYEFVEPPDIAW